MKEIDEIRGCNEELDFISMLNFVITEEFQIRPNWVFEEHLTKVGGTARFKAMLNMNLNFICQNDGQNKKDAKINCSKVALMVLAPKVFAQMCPDEQIDNKLILDCFTPPDNIETKQVPKEEIDESKITISDPRLHELTHLFKPYTPYTYIKQAHCNCLHKDWTHEITEKQNKEKNGPEDAVKLYMCMKQNGVIKYEFQCTSSSARKGRTKLSLGILC